MAKVWLITGSGNGLGRDIACLLYTSMLSASLVQAMQASGRISIEGPASTATQRILCVLAATSFEA